MSESTGIDVREGRSTKEWKSTFQLWHDKGNKASDIEDIWEQISGL